MRILCRMAIDTQYKDLPDEVVTYAKQSIFNTVAATVGALTEDELSAKYRKCATYAACRLSQATVVW